MIRRQLSRAALLLSLLALSAGAIAQSNPYQKGPTPTLSSIQADGPFAITSQTIPGTGFGGGTVYTPTTAGTYGLIAVCPGFVSVQSEMAAISKRLATHGFVVVVIDTNTLFDLPPSRATQMQAALKAVIALTTGPVVGKIDPSRQALAGWSMGGGGTLIAANSTPSLKAAFTFAPWLQNPSLSATKVPTALIGGTDDSIAPPSSFTIPLYNALPASLPKLLGIITGATHFYVTASTPNQPSSYTEIAWMKRFVDNDTRYSQFLNGDPAYATFESTGPF